MNRMIICDPNLVKYPEMFKKKTGYIIHGIQSSEKLEQTLNNV